VDELVIEGVGRGEKLGAGDKEVGKVGQEGEEG